jgi:outer membrane protein TolC
MRLRGLGAAWAALALIVLGTAWAAELPERPLTLDDCWVLARERSPSLVVAQQRLYVSEAGVQRVVSQYFPTATLLANYGRNGGSSFLRASAGTVSIAVSGTRHESEVLLSQTLWALGRRESLLSARHSLRASYADVQTAEQSIALAVAQLYYQALAAEALVKVSEATLAASRDHGKLVSARVSVGEGAPVDIAPAEADVANAEFSLLQSGNGSALAKARLKNGVGLPATYDLHLAAPGIPSGCETVPALAEAVRAALQKRPEMVSARDSVDAAQQEFHAAQIQRNGTLALTSQYDRGIAGPQKGASWSAVVSLSGFLFDAGAREADVVTARANLAILQAQEQQTANQVGLEVETARLDLDTARKSVETAEKAVTSAQSQLSAAEGKYQRGVGIFVEVLDAQRTLAQARTNQVQARYDCLTALVALQRAMGQLTLPPGQTQP